MVKEQSSSVSSHPLPFSIGGSVSIRLLRSELTRCLLFAASHPPHSMRCSLFPFRSITRLPRLFSLTLVAFLVGSTCAVASPESDLRDAIQSLADQPSYSWDVYSLPPPRPDGRPISTGTEFLVLKGKLERNGYTQIDLSAPSFKLTAFRKTPKPSVGFAETTKGWLSAADIDAALSRTTDETVSFHGRPQKEKNVLTTAKGALEKATATDEMLKLLDDVVHLRANGNDISGELTLAAAEARYKVPSTATTTTREISGSVVFHLRDGLVRGYDITVLAIDPYNPKSWGGSLRQTTIHSLGSTAAVPPQEVFDKLEQ